MLKLKVNDRVVVNTDNPSCSPLLAGDVVTVLNLGDEGDTEVETVNGVTWWVKEGEVDVFTDLPKGAQLNLGPMSPDPVECYCGGYSTFKSMSPQYHSHVLPCSSLKK